jgi:hypothetical protein
MQLFFPAAMPDSFQGPPSDQNETDALILDIFFRANISLTKER